MKRAKQRLPSALARLITSSRRANRAITRTCAAVRASNKRIRKMRKYTLAELIAEMPDGLLVDRDWDNMQPVGREIL